MFSNLPSVRFFRRAACSRSARLAATLLLVFVVQGVMLFPLHRTSDIPLWDESNYMGWGEALLVDGERLPSLANSPLYSIVYAGLIVPFGRIGAVYAMKYLAAMAAAAALCAFLAITLRSCLLALALSTSWAVAQRTVDVLPYVNQFALFVCCCALVVARRRPIVAAFLMLLCSLVRLEYLVVLAVAILIWSIQWIRRRGSIRPELRLDRASSVTAVVAMLLVMTTCLAISPDGWDLGGDRTWFAFKQHYAVWEVEKNGRYGLANPGLDYGIVIEADFKGATGFGEAMRSDPGRFWSHVGRNLGQLPRAIADMFSPASALAHKALIGLIAALGATAMGLGMLRTRKGCWIWWRRWRVQWRALGCAAPLLMCLPLAVAPTLLVLPKPVYSVALMPMLLWLIGSSLKAAADAARGTALRMVRHVPAVVVGVIVIVVWLGPRPFVVKPLLPNLESIHAADHVLPRQRTVMVGSHATFYGNYLGHRRVVAIEANPAASGLPIPPEGLSIDQLIAKYNPDAILINAELTDSPSFKRESLKLLQPPAWKASQIGQGDILYIRTRHGS